MAHKLLSFKIKHLLNNKGQGLIEYVLILALIVLTVIASLTPMGKILANGFTKITAAINGT